MKNEKLRLLDLDMNAGNKELIGGTYKNINDLGAA